MKQIIVNLFHFFNILYNYFIQNTAYKGIDFILLKKPKFFVETRIEYLGFISLI
jgi:hypothetical protein